MHLDVVSRLLTGGVLQNMLSGAVRYAQGDFGQRGRCRTPSLPTPSPTTLSCNRCHLKGKNSGKK